MEMGDQLSKWITVEVYAAQVDVSPHQLMRMIRDRVIPGEKRGNRWFMARPLVVSA